MCGHLQSVLLLQETNYFQCAGVPHLRMVSVAQSCGTLSTSQATSRTLCVESVLSVPFL